MFLLYTCDYRHTFGSKCLLAVCTNKQKAIELCQQRAKQQGGEISPHDIYLLHTIGQTQGYEIEGEFIIDEEKENVLLF